MRIILFLALIAFTFTGFSQNNNTKTEGQTSFYAEVGGPGILFSANIDKRFKRSHLGWGGRIGVGFVTAYESKIDTSNPWTYYYDEQVSVITVPAQINYIFGKGNSPHTFEVGAGITYVGKEVEIMNFYEEKASKWFGTFSFMYRRQPVDGGFTWRIGFTPIVARGYIQPFAGAGVGFNF
jgi:hypothetical protein